MTAVTTIVRMGITSLLHAASITRPSLVSLDFAQGEQELAFVVCRPRDVARLAGVITIVYKLCDVAPALVDLNQR